MNLCPFIKERRKNLHTYIPGNDVLHAVLIDFEDLLSTISSLTCRHSFRVDNVKKSTKDIAL